MERKSIHFYNEFMNMNQPDYQEFLAHKQIIHRPSGFKVNDEDINPVLFPFQRALVRYALRKGKSAIFADTGLGKTLMQLEWARLVNEHTKKPVLIIAPLSVAKQTVNEAKNKLGLNVLYTRSGDNISLGINITNYEMVKEFGAKQFGAVVLDESSILKSVDGRTRSLLIKKFKKTEYKLCCTATPAPNDIAEIANHCEFLNIMSRNEMLSTFFVNRQNQKNGVSGSGWGLKPHGESRFYRWLASWGMAVKKPSDIGYPDEGYNLPKLNIKPIVLDSGYVPEGQLFFTGLRGIQDRLKVRRITQDVKVEKISEIVNDSDEQWIIWTGLNPEATAIHKLVSDSVNVQGSDGLDSKIENLVKFQDGETRVLVTKTKIAGQGMNFQNCHNMLFCGLSDSWEAYYQAIRRIWRFGQKNNVNIYIVLADAEMEILENIRDKEREAEIMTQKLIENASQYQQEELDDKARPKFEYEAMDIKSEKYHIMLGDCVERLREIDDESIHLSVYSPPFRDLYVYTATERDVGNSTNKEDFYVHYGFIVEQLLRVTLPGRATCVHCMDIPAMKVKDGYMGVKDFSGDLIRLYEAKGWVYQGRISIAKNPQAVAIRTHTSTLMFAQLERDSVRSMPVQGDYLLKFVKPGDNPIPVNPVKNNEMTRDTWIAWAGHQSWLDISETKVLQYKKGNQKLAEDDVKHICPLQLGVPERCIKLWTNPGETVLTPFMGIGTEVYEAVRLGRFGVGIELKPEYFQQAHKNIEDAVIKSDSIDLFAYAGIEA